MVTSVCPQLSTGKVAHSERYPPFRDNLFSATDTGASFDRAERRRHAAVPWCFDTGWSPFRVGSPDGPRCVSPQVCSPRAFGSRCRDGATARCGVHTDVGSSDCSRVHSGAVAPVRSAGSTGRRRPRRRAGRFPSQGPFVLAQAIDVEPQRLARVLGGLFEAVALRVEPRQFGRVDVVAALILRFEYELHLARRPSCPREGIRRHPDTSYSGHSRTCRWGVTSCRG